MHHLAHFVPLENIDLQSALIYLSAGFNHIHLFDLSWQNISISCQSVKKGWLLLCWWKMKQRGRAGEGGRHNNNSNKMHFSLGLESHNIPEWDFLVTLEEAALWVQPSWAHWIPVFWYNDHVLHYGTIWQASYNYVAKNSNLFLTQKFDLTLYIWTRNIKYIQKVFFSLFKLMLYKRYSLDSCVYFLGGGKSQS